MGNMEKGRKTGTEKTVTEKRGSIMEKNRKWFSANDGKAGETDVPEYVKLDMEDGIDQMKVVGDTIYFVSGHWDDATSTYQRYIGKLEAGERTPEKVVLDIGEESSMMASDIDAEGNLQAVVITALFASRECRGRRKRRRCRSGRRKGRRCGSGRRRRRRCRSGRCRKRNQ